MTKKRLNTTDLRVVIRGLRLRVLVLETALAELVAAGDFVVSSADERVVMLRLGKATDEARLVLAERSRP